MTHVTEIVSISYRTTEIRLLPEKALFLPKEEILLVSDLHLGKSEHFRKNGIGVPGGSTEDTLLRLESLLESLGPKKLILLGDLFHSDYNLAWDKFEQFIYRFQNLDFHLVLGNHDILDKKLYDDIGLLYSSHLETDDLFCTHDHSTEVPDGKLNIYGHIHPAVRIRIPPRQNVKLPCFCLSARHLIVPSFGSFTGNYIVEPNNFADIFVIYGQTVELLKNK
jgi:uncharacterized protein